MSDEREGRSRPDETRPFSFGGDGRPGGRGDDATRVQPSGEAGAQGDRTSVMPPVPGGDAAWAGRAAVRPPRADEYLETETDWATPEPEQRRKWWLPILIGIIALALLGLLAWGIWLIIQAQNNSAQNPAPAPTPSVAATTSTPSATPTTTPPTTQATTTSPTPTSVTIPALRGMSQSDAQKTLSRIGLSARLRYIATTQAPAGIVIDTDPGEGKQVPQGTTVTLIVAAQQPTTQPTSPSPTGGLIQVPGQ